MEGCSKCEIHRSRTAEGLFFMICTVLRKRFYFFSSEQADPLQKDICCLEINQRAENILDTYGNSILRYAYSYLHNRSDAEEVLQDTLFQFLKAAPVFENQQHEKAWILCVAGNLSKNRLKYNALRKTDELNDELLAEQREDLSFVWEAVKSLPVKYREAIHLFYYEGYSTKQIAKILQRNEITVRSDLRRGRERLKALLKEEYEFG